MGMGGIAPSIVDLDDRRVNDQFLTPNILTSYEAVKAGLYALVDTRIPEPAGN
jgi:hypothetical protein